MKAEQERIRIETEERIAQENNKKALDRVIKEKGIVNGKSYLYCQALLDPSKVF
jgi:hypothetical protein